MNSPWLIVWIFSGVVVVGLVGYGLWHLLRSWFNIKPLFALVATGTLAETLDHIGRHPILLTETILHFLGPWRQSMSAERGPAYGMLLLIHQRLLEQCAAIGLPAVRQTLAAAGLDPQHFHWDDLATYEVLTYLGAIILEHRAYSEAQLCQDYVQNALEILELLIHLTEPALRTPLAEIHTDLQATLTAME